MARFVALRAFAGMALTGLIALVAAMPARAITGSYHPDSIHTYVGLAVFYDQNGQFSHRASFSRPAIAPTTPTISPTRASISTRAPVRTTIRRPSTTR
jgi:hypothetical protein